MYPVNYDYPKTWRFTEHIDEMGHDNVQSLLSHYFPSSANQLAVL